MISDRVFYLPELTYEYRYDTGQNDPGSGQTEVTAIVWGKKVYDRLEQLPFVDDRENYLKTAPKYSLKPWIEFQISKVFQWFIFLYFKSNSLNRRIIRITLL